jgi:8-oxo-dGTP diphosphatase
MSTTTTPLSPAPRIGVGVGILVLRDGQLLLGRRRGSHGAGTWSAPGGRLEYGESIEDCARRELLEETGLVLGPCERGPTTSDVFDEVRQHYLTVFVVARHTLGEPATLEPDKCDGWQWFTWSALPQPLFAPLASLLATGFDPAVPAR